MNRREFLKKLGITGVGIALSPLEALAQNENIENKEELIFNEDEERLIENLTNIWDYKNKHFKENLTYIQFLKLREFYFKYYEKDEKNGLDKLIENKRKRQKVRDVLFFYERVKYHYLTPLIREKVKKELNTYNSSPQLILQNINSKEESLKNGSIDFAKINLEFAKILIKYSNEYSKEYPNENYNKCSIPLKVVFIIALIENDFGGNSTSKAGAEGPMQLKPVTIAEMENKYKFLLKPPYYANLNGNAKYIRNIQTGILYIRYLILKLKLNINFNDPNRIDIIILLMCYNQGMDGILENFEPNKPFNKEAVRYVQKGFSALSYNFKFNDIKIV